MIRRWLAVQAVDWHMLSGRQKISWAFGWLTGALVVAAATAWGWAGLLGLTPGIVFWVMTCAVLGALYLHSRLGEDRH